jgi:hypothetical protein
MTYEKLAIGGAKQEILSWTNHAFSIEEQSMLRNVSRLPCLFKHVAHMKTRGQRSEASEGIPKQRCASTLFFD